jgi:hypothetical protein
MANFQISIIASWADNRIEGVRRDRPQIRQPIGETVDLDLPESAIRRRDAAK